MIFINLAVERYLCRTLCNNDMVHFLFTFYFLSFRAHVKLWARLVPFLTGALCLLTGTMLVPTLVVGGLNALLMLVDVTGKPSFITRYRIQLDKNNPVGSGPARSKQKYVQLRS